MNIEGRPQRTKTAVPPPNLARIDWHIVKAISEVLGISLPYHTDVTLRKRMEQLCPHILETNTKPSTILPPPLAILNPSRSYSKSPFKLPVEDFYLTDPICRSSPTMAQCSATFR